MTFKVDDSVVFMGIGRGYIPAGVQLTVTQSYKDTNGYEMIDVGFWSVRDTDYKRTPILFTDHAVNFRYAVDGDPSGYETEAILRIPYGDGYNAGVEQYWQRRAAFTEIPTDADGNPIWKKEPRRNFYVEGTTEADSLRQQLADSQANGIAALNLARENIDLLEVARRTQEQLQDEITIITEGRDQLLLALGAEFVPEALATIKAKDATLTALEAENQRLRVALQLIANNAPIDDQLTDYEMIVAGQEMIVAGHLARQVLGQE